MARLGLVFDLLARDRASGPLRDVGEESGRTGRALSKLGGGALAVGKVAAGGALAGIGLFTAGLVGGYQEAISYQKITDQVGQTIKATGNLAGVSVGGLKEYAGQLESMSGVDEELILKSQNVLLTFTGIRNELGKGNDIYNQASLAALNLSTTLGGDVAGSAVQVGKALNDPLKGITALGKAGVSFTEQQKAQIKQLVKTGDTMGAQKIILAELNKEFGGAAAAAGKGFGGSLSRLQDTISDSFRTIATAALPTLTKVADFLADKLPGAIETGTAFFGDLAARGKQVFDVLFRGDFTGGPFSEDSRFVDILFQVRSAVQQTYDVVSAGARVAFPALVSSVTATVGAVQGLIGFVRDNATTFQILGGAAAGVATVLGTYLIVSKAVAIGTAAVSAVTKGYAAAQLLLNLAVSANPFVIAAVAIGALVGALVVVYKKSETFRNIIDSVGRVIRDNVLPILQTYARIYTQVVFPAIRKAVEIVGSFVGALVSAGAAVGRFVGAVVGKYAEFVTAVVTKVGEVVRVVKELPSRAVQGLGDLGGVLIDAGKQLITGFISGITSKFGAVKDKLGDLTGKLTSWKGPESLDKVILKGNGQLVIEGFVRGLESRYPNVKASLGRLTKETIATAVAGADKTITSLTGRLGTVKDKLSGVEQRKGSLVDSVRSGLAGPGLTSLLGASNITDVLSKLQSDAINLNGFTAVVEKLRGRKGVSNSLADGLLALGPEQAGGLAGILANSTDKQLRGVLGLQSDIARISSGTAQAAGQRSFGAQEAALLRQSKALEAQLATTREELAELKRLTQEMKKLPAAIGAKINGAARGGRG